MVCRLSSGYRLGGWCRALVPWLKLVLEPIWEADFQPCSYGFRPNRRAHDAIAETRMLASHTYEWVVEGDIEACFDTIDHTALMDRVRLRIEDRRVLTLVKAFLKAGHPVPGRRAARNRHRDPARGHSDSSNAVGNFCFEVSLSYRRVELPRRVSGTP
jgi:hypothetical protein